MKIFVRWLLCGLSGITIAIVIALLFLLAVASANTDFFDRYYLTLYRVNLLVAALLLSTIVILATILGIRWHKGKFGTRLMAKLGLFFGVVGVLPGVLIYLVSLQFVSRSIESWFDVKVEKALEAGLNLGRVMMENARIDLEKKARLMVDIISHELSGAAQLEITSNALNYSTRNLTNQAKILPTSTAILMSRLQNEFGVQEATLLGENNQIIAIATENYAILPSLPSKSILQKAEQARIYTAIEPIASHALFEKTGLRLRVLLPLAATHKKIFGGFINKPFHGEPKYLQIIQVLPTHLSLNAEALESAYAEYQIKAIGRNGLVKMHIGTLSLTLLLVVFIAIILAILLGQQLARPLLLLFKGTQAVASGDLSLGDFSGNFGSDELGILTQQFGQMTWQLQQARNTINLNQQTLEAAKAYLESILANLTAGVLVMDGNFALTMANHGAERIFGLEITQYIGVCLDDVPFLKNFSLIIRSAFAGQAKELKHQEWQKQPQYAHWQQQISVGQIPTLSIKTAIPLILLTRGTRLPMSSGEEISGYVVVFDDITEFLSAQRALAWGEVARRLAHEIKNPLTPIQLSAERLHMKLSDKLSEQDQEILRRATTTIIHQVDSMKKMVNSFSDYARLPRAIMQKIQLNELISEVLVLYGVDFANNNEHDVIKSELAEALPCLQADYSQLRQVIHNLIQNALDAVATMNRDINLNADLDKFNKIDAFAYLKPHILLRTEKILMENELMVNDKCNSRILAVKFTIADNGSGFAPHILNQAFEPYITTKEKGTGLGLAMVKKIVDEHGAKIALSNIYREIEGSATSQLTGALVEIIFIKLAE